MKIGQTGKQNWPRNSKTFQILKTFAKLTTQSFKRLEDDAVFEALGKKNS